MQHESEVEIAKQIASGNLFVFDKLYKESSERLFHFIFNYVQNKEVAEEILQDVYLWVYNKAHTFQGQSKLSTWIHKIAINKCLDYFRSQQKKRSIGKLQGLFDPDAANPLDAPVFEHPGWILEKKEEGKKIFAAIYSLSANQKTAFLLSYVQELPRQEVADIMGISLKAVEGLLQRAKTELRIKLKIHEGND